MTKNSIPALFVFDMHDFKVIDESIHNTTIDIIRYCYYKGKRYPPDHPLRYKRRQDYWYYLAIKFAVVVIFEHVLILLKGIIAYAIPDVPSSVKQQVMHQEKTKKRIKMVEMNKKYLKHVGDIREK
ncbi:hypothetical protein ABEB36_000084 [Hypothenemus hampei]|uniref:Anoctamin transmembrane domain-containing protein n=1 Tax=Hypothenemus hampei TaxID=57062 RepID=A0ABD1FA61_HYPHA